MPKKIAHITMKKKNIVMHSTYPMTQFLTKWKQNKRIFEQFVRSSKINEK